MVVIHKHIQLVWLSGLLTAVHGVWHHTVYESEHLLSGLSQDRHLVTMTVGHRQLQTPFHCNGLSNFVS